MYIMGGATVQLAAVTTAVHVPLCVHIHVYGPYTYSKSDEIGIPYFALSQTGLEAT